MDNIVVKVYNEAPNIPAVIKIDGVKYYIKGAKNV